MLSGGTAAARIQAEAARVAGRPEHTPEAVSFRMSASGTGCGRAGAACAALHRAAPHSAVLYPCATRSGRRADVWGNRTDRRDSRHVPSFDGCLRDCACVCVRMKRRHFELPIGNAQEHIGLPFEPQLLCRLLFASGPPPCPHPSFASFRTASNRPGPARMPTIRTATGYPAVFASGRRLCVLRSDAGCRARRPTLAAPHCHLPTAELLPSLGRGGVDRAPRPALRASADSHHER